MKAVTATTLSLLVILVGAGISLAQPGWTSLPSGTGNDLVGVSAAGPQAAVAVGSQSTVLRTDNGGASWVPQNPGVVTNYSAVSFCDANVGTLTGAGGAIFETANGGTTWDEVQFGWMLSYHAAHQMNAQTSIVAGANTIFQCWISRTENGWLSMVNQNFYPIWQSTAYEGAVRGLRFLDASTLVAAVNTWNGLGMIERSTDQGQNWTTTWFGGYDTGLLALDFPSANVGYAVGINGTCIKTENGGQTWSALTTGTSSILYGVAFLTEQEGWAVGDSGLILHTTNGGTTWETQPSGIFTTLYAVDFSSAGLGYAVGEGGIILGYGELTVPDVTVTLAPAAPPVQVPAGGGSFQFDATLTNPGTASQSCDAWIMARLPNGSWYGPVLGPLNLTLPAGGNLTRQRVQSVPATAPAGDYWYEGRVGYYPDLIADSSGFGFTKLATGNGPFVGDWACTGESFPGEVGGTSSVASLPERVAFSASPNPFNPTTVASYELRAASYVSLRVYDTAGREVAALVNGWREAGAHKVTFDASGLPSGIYFARLSAGNLTQTQKLILLK
ncbi:MAG: T9SS C-terminal target domain-containing protein [Candidatus Zixiibacteriota bacterium]|nr:MAG: T9SS C-terminal target domain-containing protein [candidate division Zixibacteria bacterium]